MFPALKPKSSAIGRASSVPARSVSAQTSHVSDRARQLFLAKQEARRQRRTLKESGDFLGVTGFNPETGELDILTPTTSSGGTPPGSPHLTELAKKAQEAQAAYEKAKKEAQARLDQERKYFRAREKESIGLEQRRIKWRREGGQWSSVAEPRLSPIPQSRRNSFTAQSSDATTVRHGHDSFLGTEAAPAFTVTTRCRQSSQDSSESTQDTRQSTSLKQTPQAETPTPVKSSSPKRRTVRLSIPPIIPRRLGHSQQSIRPQDVKQTTVRRPSLELKFENQNPAERWASTLLQDLNGLEKSTEANSRRMKALAGSIMQNIGDLEKGLESVCTPTTTTTGCVLSPQICNVSDEKGGMSQGTRPEAVSTLAHTESPLSETSMNRNNYSNLLASQPPKQPNVWSSLPDLPLETTTQPMNGSQAAEPVET
ncbi:hypothetical protein V8F20_003789 [Naviculisporaceae sp. PSN 640]